MKRFLMRTICLIPVTSIILVAVILYWITGKYITGHITFLGYKLLGKEADKC